MNKLNQILESEGVKTLKDAEFKGIRMQYNNKIDSFTSELGSGDFTYGVHGKAAQWGDMSGGAEQIVTPLAGDTMQKLGIIIGE